MMQSFWREMCAAAKSGEHTILYCFQWKIGSVTRLVSLHIAKDSYFRGLRHRWAVDGAVKPCNNNLHAG